jgi:ribosomal protein L29
MVTQAEYENKIIKFQSDINNNLYEINFLSAERDGNLKHAQRTGDYEWGAKQADIRNIKIEQFHKKNEALKSEMWNFQKQTAQDEQDAQIKAIRIAIADQVRLEQEKIIQSRENQEIIIIGEQQTQKIEPIKEKSFALGSLSLVALTIGGFLVLR